MLAGLCAAAGPAEAGLGLFDQAQSLFALRRQNDPGPASAVVQFGPPNLNYQPLLGDWNGDGIDTIGLYDSVASIVVLRNANNSGGIDHLFSFGTIDRGWKAVAGDWNGDGIDTIGVFNPLGGVFRFRNVLSAGKRDMMFRVPGAKPLPELLPIAGDWDGDGIDTVGTYQPATRTFRLWNSLSEGAPPIEFRFGPATGARQAVAGDWNGDGVDTVGLYLGDTGQFSFRNAHGDGAPSGIIAYGPAGARLSAIVGELGSAPAVTELDPTDGGTGFLWKPQADHGGDLVVLLPSSFNGRVASVEVHDASPPTSASILDTGRFGGIGNGNRTHWRFGRPGSAYGPNVYLTVFTEESETFVYFIADGSRRID